MSIAPVKRPHLRLQVFGAPGEPGVLAIQDSGISLSIALSANAFAAVLALAEKGVLDAQSPAWAPRGFLTTKQLRQALTNWQIPRLSPHYIAKHIHRARQQLTRQARKVEGLDAEAWSHELLEFSQEFRAYRISAPAKQIYVHPYKPSPR